MKLSFESESLVLVVLLYLKLSYELLSIGSQKSNDKYRALSEYLDLLIKTNRFYSYYYYVIYIKKINV